MAKKKAPEVPTSAAKVPGVLQNATLARLVDEAAQMAWPVLYECLIPQYEGSKLLRPAGKISISVEGVYLRVQLDMPYERLTARMYSQSLTTALADLNAYLGSRELVLSPMYEKNKKPLPRLDAPIQ